MKRELFVYRCYFLLWLGKWCVKLRQRLSNNSFGMTPQAKREQNRMIKQGIHYNKMVKPGGKYRSVVLAGRRY